LLLNFTIGSLKFVVCSYSCYIVIVTDPNPITVSNLRIVIYIEPYV